MGANSTTTFTSRGRLRGLVRDQPAFDEALYYRARLILGEALPHPGRRADGQTGAAQGRRERNLPISGPK
jgi:hypothetical protein